MFTQLFGACDFKTAGRTLQLIQSQHAKLQINKAVFKSKKVTNICRQSFFVFVFMIFKITNKLMRTKLHESQLCLVCTITINPL